MKRLTYTTELKVKGTIKKLYLSAIIDLCEKSIISYVMGFSNDNQLMFNTI